RPSQLASDGDTLQLALETFSPDGDAHPSFFDGFARRPDLVATALLAVARVARTRFYMPPGMVAAKIRAADPIVSCDGERLRFGSLSVCGGVYARLDVLPDGLDGARLAVGTTNIDMNPALRDALGRLGAAEPLHLAVGADEVRFTTLDESI